MLTTTRRRSKPDKEAVTERAGLPLLPPPRRSEPHRTRLCRAMPDGLPTPRTTLRAGYVRVVLTCRSCLHQRDADLEALIASGRGDVPLVSCAGSARDADTARSTWW